MLLIKIHIYQQQCSMNIINLEVSESFLVRLLHCQSFPQVSHVIDTLKLSDSWNVIIGCLDVSDD